MTDPGVVPPNWGFYMGDETKRRRLGVELLRCCSAIFSTTDCLEAWSSHPVFIFEFIVSFDLQHPGTGIAKCATPQPQHKFSSALKMLKSC